MKKSTRRIFSLALAIAFICALATVTFAVTDDWAYEFDNTAIVLEMAGTIDEEEVCGEMYVNYIYGAYYFGIDIAHTYYPMPLGSPAVTERYSDSDYFYTSGSQDAVREYSVTVPAGNTINAQLFATFNFSTILQRLLYSYDSPPYSIEYK